MKAVNREALRGISPIKELAISWITMFVVGSDLFVVSPLLDLIAADYGVPPDLVAINVTVFSLTYMLSAPILGHVADKIGRRRVLIYCLFAFGIANMLTAGAEGLLWLLAARLFAGAAAAGVSPSVYALVGRSAPSARRATSLAIVVSGLLMSLSFGAPIGALLAASFGWRLVFAALGALSLLLVWANARAWHDDHPTGNSTVASERLTIIAVAPRLAPTVAWSTALYAMYTYLGDGLAALGYSTADIAAIILAYGIGAISGVVIGGRMADRLGAGLTSAIALGSLCCCFLLLRVALCAGVFVGLAFALSSAAAQLYFPAQQIRLAQAFPARRATILAWNNTALFLGISLGSLIGGQAMSFGGFSLDLTISASITLVGWTINHRHRQTRASVPFTRPGRRSGTQGAR
jgi:predicted MFS family arabinose efflux permease